VALAHIDAATAGTRDGEKSPKANRSAKPRANASKLLALPVSCDWTRLFIEADAAMDGAAGQD
jgi:hypothetical protein